MRKPVRSEFSGLFHGELLSLARIIYIRLQLTYYSPVNNYNKLIIYLIIIGAGKLYSLK